MNTKSLGCREIVKSLYIFIRVAYCKSVKRDSYLGCFQLARLLDNILILEL